MHVTIKPCAGQQLFVEISKLGHNIEIMSGIFEFEIYK